MSSRVRKRKGAHQGLQSPSGTGRWRARSTSIRTPSSRHRSVFHVCKELRIGGMHIAPIRLMSRARRPKATPPTLALATVVLALAGCSDTGTDRPSGEGSDDAGVSLDGDGGQVSGCELANAVRVSELSVDGLQAGTVITAQAGAGSVVAWTGNDGIHITPLDGADQRSGADLVVPGTQLFGIAATASDVAVLSARPPDYMSFMRVDLSGTVLGSADLVGGGDHALEGVEWFGEFANTGRLVARGDGSFAAYHGLHRRWPDGIGHQGDTLRLLAGDGSSLGGGWDWGCSHSVDQRLASGPSGLVPVCVSDCYPTKGIHFNHNQTEITSDPGANCAGNANTALGGLVAVADGFFLVYQDAAAAAHLAHFDAVGAVLAERVLSQPGSSRLASFEDGMLLGSPSDAGGTSLQRLDSAGQDIGETLIVAEPLPSQDFESRSDGQVAWAVASAGAIHIVRVGVCD